MGAHLGSCRHVRIHSSSSRCALLVPIQRYEALLGRSWGWNLKRYCWEGHRRAQCQHHWDLYICPWKLVSHRGPWNCPGLLFCVRDQAMQHPNLTPAGSLRTSLLSIFKDTLHENMDVSVHSLGRALL